jgi:hypothetical protein
VLHLQQSDQKDPLDPKDLLDPLDPKDLKVLKDRKVSADYKACAVSKEILAILD